MLVVDRAQGSFAHHSIRDLPDLLNENDALVLNNTKVIPARAFGKKASGGAVEVLFIEPENETRWRVMMKSSRRPRPGVRIALHEDLELEVLENRHDGLNTVQVHGDRTLLDVLNEIGAPPLPPYITRDAYSEEDRQRYQTVYASREGAVAAPTAGLHFTEDLLARCRARGVRPCELTLHVGPGTFRPVKADDLTEHKMDEERYEFPPASADVLNSCRAAGGKITAVGSTSVRTLESVYAKHQTLCADQGRSDLFIYPGYTFHAVDQILTNFHLPKSTLIMMMAAFAGRELILEAYREAIANHYRFYSYGDCMFIR